MAHLKNKLERILNDLFESIFVMKCNKTVL